MQNAADCKSIDGLAEEFLARRRRGERPSIEEYADAHPERASEIHEVFQAILIMEDARGHFGNGDTAEANAAGELNELKEVGDFRIVREVGRGGMGIVYEAVQQALDRRVALKLLPRHLSWTGNQVDRFQREVHAAAGLHHSNIIPIYGVGEHDGLHFYVMQLIDGLSLERVIAQLRRGRDVSTAPWPRPGDPAARTRPATADRTLSEEENKPSPALDLSGAFGSGLSNPDTQPAAYRRWVARLGIDAANALDYAHRRGVLHRDVKPSNLLIDYDGRVWVGDFGLAKIVAQHAGDDEDALTASGEVVGTIRYMAPERFQGQADARSDVYGLGLILYELLAFQSPFDARDRVELMHQVVHREPPPLRKLDPRIPLDLQTIVAKAIEKDPRRRYASAAELAKDLQRFVDDRPVQARRIGPPKRAWRWCRRNPLAASLTGVIILLSSITFAAVALEMDGVVQREKAARAERDHIRIVNESLLRTMGELRQAYYAVRINLAANAWETPGGVRRTRELLEMLRPAEGEADRRGFEWHYLYRLSHPERQVLRGHTATVDAVAYSPDGSRLASLARDGMVRLYDPVKGSELLSWQAHAHHVGGLEFTPDGAMIATAGPLPGSSEVPGGCTVRLWNAVNGAEVRTLQPKPGLRVFHLCFDEKGKRLFAGGSTYKGLKADRSFVCVFDVETGEQRLCIEDCGPALALSPDGKQLAAETPGRLIKLIDPQTGEPLRTVATMQTAPWSLTYSPDGRFLAAAHARGVTVWDAGDGSEVSKTLDKITNVRRVVFQPGNNLMAAASEDDGAVYLLDVRTGRTVRVFKGHDSAATGLAFRPDGRFLATSSGDRTIGLWDLGAHKGPFPLDSRDGAVAGVALSRDGKTLVSRHQRMDPKTRVLHQMTHLWDLRSGKQVWSRAEAGSRGIAAGADGEQFATWTEDGKVTIWDLKTHKEFFRYQEEFQTIRQVVFSADGLSAAATCHTGNQSETIVRDARNGIVRQRFPANGRLVQNAALSPDGARLAEVSQWAQAKPNGFEVVIWDVSTGQKLLTRQQAGGGTLGVLSVYFSRDGRLLATLHPDGTVRVWDSWTCTERHCLRGHSFAPSDAAFSPDGRRLATAGFDQTIRLWDLESGHELLTLRPGSPCSSIAFSADGHWLVAGCGSRILCWDATPVPDEKR